MLELICFGPPQVLLEKEPLTKVLTPKALGLLCYLAINSKPHSREQLAGLLWSELDNQQARSNLRYLLPELRKAIGQYLQITPQAIGFDRQQRYLLDVEVLQTTLTAKPAASLQQLQAALDLYQGEFLEGFTVRNAPLFEAWMVRQRENLSALVLSSLFGLAEQYDGVGEYYAALAVTQRLLHWEPWHEGGHRLQMRLLATTGQRSAALAQYVLCRTELADELNVEPEAATTALYEQIRNGAFDKGLMVPAHNGASPDGHVAKVSRFQPTTIHGTTQTPPLPPHNLPGQLTPLIGREMEVAELCMALLEPDQRLVTLVGEGGVGKTRLAMAVAQAIVDRQAALLGASTNYGAIQLPFPDGVWYIPFAEITNLGNLMDQFATAIGTAIALPFIGHQSLLHQLLTGLRQQRTLLLFDNAEHLFPEIVDFLVQILQNSPYLTILVTSRRLLNIQAEAVWPVSGLSLPAVGAIYTPTTLLAYSSISLFVERARRAKRDFRLTYENQSHVSAICRLVDGLPLAIELAAALTKQYSCAEIEATLQADYTFLASSFADLTPRHRSITALFDYSWHFLTGEEAETLAACSIFAGGFTRTAASAVTGATPAILAALVDQSLLRLSEGRYTMHELIHQYASVQLTQVATVHQTVQARHAVYYIELLHRLAPALLAEIEAQEAVRCEWDNIRSAWRASATQSNLTLLEMGLESLQAFYQLAALYREAIHLLNHAIGAVRQLILAPTKAVATNTPQAEGLLARLLCHTAQFYRRSGDWESGERVANEALVLGCQLADPALQGLAYHELARLAYVRGNFSAMRALAEAGCLQARQSSSAQLIAECLNDLGLAVGMSVGPLAAIAHFHDALDKLKSVTNRVLEAFIHVNLGFFYLACHEYQSSCHFLQPGIALQRRLQVRGGSIMPLIYLGDLWTALGVYDAAQQEYEQALLLAQAIQSPYSRSCLYTSLARLHQLRGDLAAAQTTGTYASQIAQQSKIPVQEQWALVYLGHVLMAQGDIAGARRTYQQAIALHKAENWVYRTADAHAGLAALLLATNELPLAVTHIETALTFLSSLGLAGANEPFTVYWTAVRVLQAAGDPRAMAVLQRASHDLQAIAGQLVDVNLRQSFLEKVAVNRQLVAAAQAAGVG